MQRLPDQSRPSLSGISFALAGYLLWGFLPLYFLALEPTGAIEVVAWRVLFSFAFCLLLVTVTPGGWSRLWNVVRKPRTMLLLLIAGILILGNWLVYVFAVYSGQIVEAALGFFINPIVTVMLGVIVLRERLKPLQWAAIGVSCVAVAVLISAHDSKPWVALVLAATFGLYGLVKRFVGGAVDAVSGLTVETALISPVAVMAILVLSSQGVLSFGREGALHVALLLLAGVVTAMPLLLFAAAARRLRLAALGLAQYVSPILQLLLGAVIMHEGLPLERWVAFALVWLALVLLTFDMFQKPSAAANHGACDL